MLLIRLDDRMKIGNSTRAGVTLCLLALVAAPALAQQPATGPQGVRIEHNLLGEKAVPADAYYGVQTARALENFRISGRTIGDYPSQVDGFAATKMAAAMANTTDKGILEIIREKKILTEAQIEELLDAGALTGLDPNDYK